MNIKFPEIMKDESFEFFAYFEIGQQFDLSLLNGYVSDWFIVHANKEIFGRTLKDEFQITPKAKVHNEKLVLQFIGTPSQNCNWADRMWKDWFVKLVSEILEGKLEIIKLIECKNADDI